MVCSTNYSGARKVQLFRLNVLKFNLGKNRKIGVRTVFEEIKVLEKFDHVLL